MSLYNCVVLCCVVLCCVVCVVLCCVVLCCVVLCCVVLCVVCVCGQAARQPYDLGTNGSVREGNWALLLGNEVLLLRECGFHGVGGGGGGGDAETKLIASVLK